MSCHNGKYILFSLVSLYAKIDIDVYGDMDNIINYVKKHGQILTKLSRILCVSERYIFANIMDCVNHANLELKGAQK